MLFCLDDIIGVGGEQESSGVDATVETSSSSFRVKELEDQLQRVQEQFAEYRQAVSKTLDERWADKASSSKTSGEPSTATNVEPKRDDDTHYFDSYSYNGQCIVSLTNET